MLTIFSTPKPFAGHIGIIQQNAIQSWKRIHPNVEVILLGDEEGTAEIAQKYEIRHLPKVERNEKGTPYVASIFDQAQSQARHDVLCYANCDIILMSDFGLAVGRVSDRFPRFLMAGRRWDIEIAAPLDFSGDDWERHIRGKVRKNGKQRPPQWIDFFVFRRDPYHKIIPPFVVGRPGWDNWLLWKARASGAAVVDASAVVLTVHQNHDYAHHPEGEAGVWQGEEARRNYALLRNGRHFGTLENATHLLTAARFRRNYKHWPSVVSRWLRSRGSSAWFGLLDVTRPIRHRLGLRAPSRVSGPKLCSSTDSHAAQSAHRVE